MSEEKLKVPTKFAEADMLLQKLLQLADVHVDVAMGSKVPAGIEEDAAGLFTQVEKAKARIAFSKAVETTTVRLHEELTDMVKERHAEKVSIWKDVCQENAHGLIDDLKVVNVNSIKTSMEWNLMMSRSE